MSTFSISQKEIASVNQCSSAQFPKYTSQLINLANQNGKGTRPNVVGQMSELFQQYQEEAGVAGVTLQGWREWYLKQHPEAIRTASKKIHDHLENLKKAIQIIDEEMIRRWVEDLVITKTYSGLYVQKAILTKIAEREGASWRLARPEEESRGIDGCVGDVEYSIKPATYRTMDRLSETIEARMVYYTKGKDKITVEVEE